MLTEHYNKILDDLTEWKIGVDNYHKTKISGRPRLDKKDNEASEPLKGYPVVLALKKAAHPCDWCDGTCVQNKVYTRTPSSNLWKAKCQDCGEIRNIHTSQINFTK